MTLLALHVYTILLKRAKTFCRLRRAKGEESEKVALSHIIARHDMSALTAADVLRTKVICIVSRDSELYIYNTAIHVLLYYIRLCDYPNYMHFSELNILSIISSYVILYSGRPGC